MKVSQRKSTLLKKFPHFARNRLEITEQSALRLSRLLEEYASELITTEQESDRDFAKTWSQLFAMYGIAGMAHGFMVDDTPFENEIVSHYFVGAK